MAPPEPRYTGAGIPLHLPYTPNTPKFGYTTLFLRCEHSLNTPWPSNLLEFQVNNTAGWMQTAQKTTEHCVLSLTSFSSFHAREFNQQPQHSAVELSSCWGLDGAVWRTRYPSLQVQVESSCHSTELSLSVHFANYSIETFLVKRRWIDTTSANLNNFF